MASMREQIAVALSRLAPRERRVIEMRFGFQGSRAHTLQEVGAALGVSRERARQIEAKALKRLRALAHFGRAFQGLRAGAQD